MGNLQGTHKASITTSNGRNRKKGGWKNYEIWVYYISVTGRFISSLASLIIAYKYMLPFWAHENFKIFTILPLVIGTPILGFLQYFPRFQKRTNSESVESLIRGYLFLLLASSVIYVWGVQCKFELDLILYNTEAYKPFFAFFICAFLEPALAKQLYLFFEAKQKPKSRKSFDKLKPREEGGKIIPIDPNLRKSFDNAKSVKKEDDPTVK